MSIEAGLNDINGATKILWHRTLWAFAINAVAAVFGTALIERVESISAIQHVSWLFFKGFGFSFLFAAALGFAIQQLWPTGTGKWVWILTTAILLLGVAAYCSRSHLGSQPGYLSWILAVWNHFFGHDCFTTFKPQDCGDLLIYTSTLNRGVGYAMGALLAERLLQGGPKSVSRVD